MQTVVQRFRLPFPLRFLGSVAMVLMAAGLLGWAEPGALQGETLAIDQKEWQSALAGIYTLGAKRPPMPKTLQKKDAVIPEGLFDPNAYLTVLKHLSLADGYRLDFVYDYQDLGGTPIIYAHRIDEKRLTRLSEFSPKKTSQFFLGDDSRFSPFYLPYIKTDGTPQGFLELALLVMTGEQFYLFWHAVKFHYYVVETPEDIAHLCEKLPPEVASAAKKIDPSPTVTADGDQCTASFVIWSSWTGFTRVFWTARRAFPHTFVGVRKEVLATYSCGLSL